MKFENRTIHVGDNLDVMRGMESGTYDLIYADPPFNSNRDYGAFADTWGKEGVSVFDLEKICGYNFNLQTIVDLAGNVHSAGMRSYLLAMTLRLIEMRRLLKPDGAIYLHCDDSADYFLRALMDGIFGADKWVSTIHRKRHTAHNGKTFGRIMDTIHVYGGEPKNAVTVDLDKDYVDNFFSKSDSRGRYQSSVLTAPDVADGESGQPWKGYDPTDVGRHWSPPLTGEYARYIERRFIPGYTKIKGVHDRLDVLDEYGLVYWSGRKVPRLKRYLMPGQRRDVTNLWLDCTDNQKTEFPTEKSLGAMKRIVEAATNYGDKVLDAFCGSGTMCIASESLGREWNAIELSGDNAEFAKNRIFDNLGMFGGSQVRIS